jgi:hypothetical protein
MPTPKWKDTSWSSGAVRSALHRWFGRPSLALPDGVRHP